MTTVDEISPSTIGEDKITLTVDDDSATETFKPLIVNIDYSATEPEGVMVPLEMIVQPGFGTGTGFKREIFRNRPPRSFTFVPTEAGVYLLRLKELYHNRWQGRLLVTVAGEEFSQLETLRS
jgi:hypothetical protein